ncbi:MAG: O-antigen ligase family protein, partial [Phycisphaeraceae bacterium]|nr:O-antigen ligase family protein [Phycisphaeraceae bacterium]
TTDIRLLWWRSSLRQWGNHPLLGYGLGGTAEALRSDPELTANQQVSKSHLSVAVFNQPHSVYLQVLLEGGILGIGTFAFVLLAIFRAGWRNSLRHPLGAIAIGGLIVWMTTAAFDAWHTRSQPLAFLWFTALLAAFDPVWITWDSRKNAIEDEHSGEMTGLSKSTPSDGR